MKPDQNDWQKVVVDWNQTHRQFPKELLVHKLFEHTVSRYPDATAAEWGDAYLSYYELNGICNQLAHFLQQCGAQPELPIGLCVERGLNIAYGVLAILKSGSAYVPIDPKFPNSRIDYIVRDSGLKLLLTQTKFKPLFEHLDVDVFYFDEILPLALAKYPTQYLQSSVSPSNLAYIIYTSGSTGLPKGVLVPHASVCNMGLSEVSDFEITSQSRVLQVAPLIFDVSIFEMLMGWFGGGTVVFASENDIITGRALKDKAISNAAFTPSLLATLNPDDYPDLKVVITVGEACSANIVSIWANKKKLLNVYGPTETTGHCSFKHLRDDGSVITVGTPIANVQIYILDDAFQPVAIGDVGEIYVGGAGVTRGYLNKAELTNKRFISNPFSDSTSEKLYKTGDLARFKDNGDIEYIGRIDHQVKVSGYRIELGEIESNLQNIDGISQASVLVIEDADGNKSIAAFLILASNSMINEYDVRTKLKELVPVYMIPTRINFLEKMPLNINGKVDRDLLLQIENKMPESLDCTAPTEIQLELMRIWKQMLGRDSVPTDKNFFDMGGQSIMFPVMFVEVLERYAVEIKIESFIENPTIQHLANHIETLR